MEARAKSMLSDRTAVMSLPVDDVGRLVVGVVVLEVLLGKMRRS